MKPQEFFGRRGPIFEVSCWRLAIPLSWWISSFFTMKGVELIHLYYKTWWDAFRSTDDAGISLISNPFAAFTNTLLSHAESCNNWLESFRIIVDGIWRTKMMRALTWSGKYSWNSNHIYIMIEFMNISPVYTAELPLLSSNVMRFFILGSINYLVFCSLGIPSYTGREVL